MSDYAVSFRIGRHIVGGRDYDDRRRLLVENAILEDGGYWDGTTSFILAESDLGTYSFTTRVAEGLSEEHDMLFVFDPSDMSAAYFGKLNDADVLRSFFPSLKKLP